jgi:hypothetical protein
VTPSAHVVVAGSYSKTPDSPLTSFIADLASNSDNSTFFYSAVGYSPKRVCATQDGMIWTLGQPSAAELNQVNSGSALVHGYTSAGVLGHSFLTTTDLSINGSVDFGRRSRATPAFLLCSGNSVGVYVGLPGTGIAYWSQFDASSGLSHSWRLAVIPNTRIQTIVMLDNSNIFAGSVSSTGQRYIYHLSLNNDGTASWIRLSSADSQIGRLLGNDGQQLVSTISASGSKPDSLFGWLDPP